MLAGKRFYIAKYITMITVKLNSITFSKVKSMNNSKTRRKEQYRI